MDHNEEPNSPPKKMKRNYLPIILLVLCFAASALAGALLASSSVFDSAKEPIKRIVTSDKEEPLIKATDKSIVLIMGVDKREDDVGRSDTLMVATIDPNLDKATLLSIPRDTRVKIRGRGYDKINAAFAYGGVSLAQSTVENFLGINIDHYVMIDTGSFVKIIDAIGGVDIDVEKRMFYEDPWDDNGGLVIDLYPGQQHMDGRTAVTYVRYRDSEGDIGRVKRQQAFMAACMDKVTSPEIVPRIPKIVREVIDAVETDMSLSELLGLAGALKAAASRGLESDMVPGHPIYIDEISYWIPDVEMMRISVADALGIKIDPNLRSRFERDAREYRDSIPSDARDVPEGEDRIGSTSEQRRRAIADGSLRHSDIDERTTIERGSSVNERGRFENNGTDIESQSYDDRRQSTQSNDTDTENSSRRYDERDTDNRRYDSDRDVDSRRYDSDRDTESRRYEQPRIERRNIPDVDYSEPTRDASPETRY